MRNTLQVQLNGARLTASRLQRYNEPYRCLKFHKNTNFSGLQISQKILFAFFLKFQNTSQVIIKKQTVCTLH